MSAYRHTLTRQATPETIALGLRDAASTHDGLGSLVRLLARQAAQSSFAALRSTLNEED